ncbi:DUF1765-domain-containing protein [Xylariaceae sp. FL1651]|nr:DUF1765-domain-containing protein [Xylariaceae sp. FL1651]
MTGPTLTVTVSPAVESTQSFRSPSSHPSPELDPPSTTNVRSVSSSHTRSWSNKSLPNLPAYAVPAIDFDADFSTNLTFVPEPPIEHTNEKSAIVFSRHSSVGSRPGTERMGKRRSMMLSRPQSWMPSSRSTPDLGSLARATNEEMAGVREDNGALTPNSISQDSSRNVSDSFASYAKRSWISTSRSPSPNTRHEEVTKKAEDRPGRERAPSNSSIMKLRKGSRTRSSSSSSESSRSNESMGKIGNYLNKIKSRPQTALVKGKVPIDLDSPASSTTSLAPPSTDTRKSHASETSNSTFPEDVGYGGKTSNARDPLWSTFKSLEADFQRFQTKTTALKMNLVRSVLVPFLRNYASHPSNVNLHHEDLERRAVILNKWWTGLLDLLHVQTHPPVPGVDRPILLDAVSTIMMRPEWRQSTPTFRPLVDRNPQELVSQRSQAASNESTSSVHSTDSAYLAESTGHNVRNMFTANLVSQMAIVVEKMSLRHAPNSLVNFAGKACAYAFFFAPGIADVLVRLWTLSPDFLRRMADEFELPRRSKGESDDIVALFPPSLNNLGWTSVKAMSDTLRKAAQPPLASTKISWNGPWVARWNGRDSDLFFIFCKYYFILAEGFMPVGLPLFEKARAPGFVLVNAQLLSILDSTIHRQAAVEAMAVPPLSDALHGVDASAMALHMAPSNSNILKGMTENRLIILLKDMLSNASASFTIARYTFAESFMAVMKAAAKRTSQFDHSACFTICDFLEESLVVYSNFIDISTSELVYVDWSFWFEVCKKILESNNSMSEIRVLSLVYSIWETIASDQSRKESACLDWLLTEMTFDKLFNNWCPMVRAYFMRLLCWRICRDAGSTSEFDTKIFLVVFNRLKTVWSHYLWLKQHAEREGKFPPSTAPSFPTPGKRFMIIRTELPTIQPGLIAGFDTSPVSSSQDTMAGPATDFDSMNTFTPEVSTAKKRWSLLGKVFSFTANPTVPNDLETLRRDTAASRTTPAPPPKLSTGVVSPTGSDTDSIGSSPTYEATQYVFKFMLSWNNAGTMPPPNRVLTRPRLPNPAQSWVAVKGHTGNPPPTAGLPAPTRAISGSPLPGLVDSAKNAESPESVPTSPSNVSMALDRRSSIGQPSSIDLYEDEVPLRNAASLNKENLVNPVQPKGSFATSVKYAGRALAEWSLVVAECNSFVERRRDEGVLGLYDVEVPVLGVEGFRKIC